MRINFRPSTPADAPAIIQLLKGASLEPNVEPEALDWKYWRQREDWSGSRSFVATRGAEILAHAAVVPGNCATDLRGANVLHLIDWAAQSDAAGVGVSLMKHIGRLADVLLAVGGSDQTLRILPHIGFRPWGTTDGYVRVLHPLRFRDAFGAAVWKYPAKLAIRSLWHLASPFAKPAGWSVRRIGADETTVLAKVLPRGTPDRSVFQRSEGLFRHMLTCPIMPMELYALKMQDHVRGYFLLAFAPGQARIADCWVSTDDPAEWQALIQCAALQASRHRDVAEIVAWSSEAIMARALTAAGFHCRRKWPIFLRFTSEDGAIAERLRLQMLDNDAAYLHHRFAQWWA